MEQRTKTTWRLDWDFGKALLLSLVCAALAMLTNLMATDFQQPSSNPAIDTHIPPLLGFFLLFPIIAFFSSLCCGLYAMVVHHNGKRFYPLFFGVIVLCLIGFLTCNISIWFYPLYLLATCLFPFALLAFFTFHTKYRRIEEKGSAWDLALGSTLLLFSIAACITQNVIVMWHTVYALGILFSIQTMLKRKAPILCFIALLALTLGFTLSKGSALWVCTPAVAFLLMLGAGIKAPDTKKVPPCEGTEGL